MHNQSMTQQPEKLNQKFRKNQSASADAEETQHITQLFSTLSKEQLQKIAQSLNDAVHKAKEVVQPEDQPPQQPTMASAVSEVLRSNASALFCNNLGVVVPSVFEDTPESLASASTELCKAAVALAAPATAPEPGAEPSPTKVSSVAGEMEDLEASTEIPQLGANVVDVAMDIAPGPSGSAVSAPGPSTPSKRIGSRSPRRGGDGNDADAKVAKSKVEDNASGRSRASSAGSSKSGRSTKSQLSRNDPAEKFSKMSADLQAQLLSVSRSTKQVEPSP